MHHRLLKITLAATLALPSAAALAQADHAAHHATPEAHAAHHQKLLTEAAANPRRSEANRARDAFRHPVETLGFFGVEPHDTVVELWPGGGWYTEILSPYLAKEGTLYALNAPGRGADALRTKLAADPEYAKVKAPDFILGGTAAVPDGTADVVLTFRNVHNWVMGDPPIAKDVFAAAYKMLKPGGTLGIVDHRLPEGTDSAREQSSGYLKTSTVRALAEAAGFRFAGSSEINANPKDTTDWPKGVWTLPPTYALKDVDREKYRALGESDRMTLKFTKPE